MDYLLQTKVSEEEASFKGASTEDIAILHLKLITESSFIEKFTIHASLDANWEHSFNDNKFPVDSIVLEVGYPDSSGTLAIKNSGKIINDSNSDVFYPMIWNQETAKRCFQTAFVKQDLDNEVTIRYQVRFKISTDLPVNFKDTFTGKNLVKLPENGLKKNYMIRFYLIKS